MSFITNTTDKTYKKEFWDALRQDRRFYSEIKNTQAPRCGAHTLPAEQVPKYTSELVKRCFFRRYATCLPMYGTDAVIHTIETEATAEWVPEGNPIPEDIETLNSYKFGTHKLASIAKLHVNLLEDSGFAFEDWILKTFATRFGEAEEKAFLTGTGDHQPVGILASSGGAEIGSITAAQDKISMDEVIALFYSVDSKYRQNAIWVMNDETAMKLRTLKDAQGNYLWPPSSEKLLGKEVAISNAMPSVEQGGKPIAFGDFSYYTIMERVPFAIDVLREKYALSQLRGYVGYEHLDGKLIRPDAIKVIKMAD